MQEIEIVVDYNGIVVFDPDALTRYFGGIAEGFNIYKRLTSSEDGEKVIRQGIAVPILGINDSFYKVFTRMESEPAIIAPHLIVVQNSIFPLQVTEKLVIADLSVFLEWGEGDAWQYLDIAPGFYEVTVQGFREIKDGAVSGFGFEILFRDSSSLPEFTASLDRNMQILEIPE